MPSTTKFRARLTLVFFVSCLAIGCGSSERKYVPTTDAARKALDLVLGKWKAGDAHARVTGPTVPIDVFDERWQKGKKLESYEILREEKAENLPKVFAVKMKLTDDKEESEVKYYIVGKDPLLIFRDVDYNKAAGMGG